MSESTTMTKLVRPLRGGQITIPAEFRKRLGITDETMLQVRLDDGELRIRPVRLSDATEGSPWLRELYAYFAPVRQEIIERNIPEEEVNADIDAAIKAARASRRSSR
ncbi:MAG TPA: AbrB/MazE/SpoVT family DNA-binding domain-containing protein [Thermomicrobiales bacterium]|nr:AbrB/MazE/SpoVT family DNA-binding domain-containing protein [Thermomicrobiales bacterium]